MSTFAAEIRDHEAAYKREKARWYPLIEHPIQRALVDDAVRFKVAPAGRRSGKTERAKRKVVREAYANPGKPYFIAAPTRDQVKRIYWQDIKLLSYVGSLGDRYKSESDLIITLPNGASISLIGLDQPQRMEGVFWAGGVVDEIADTKETAWAENISPALDTYNPLEPDYRAWCWLIGVPDGLNHYYDIAEYARTANDPSWKLYHWKSSEILPPDVIEAAKRRMSARQFRQEYEASFETASGKVYEDYGPANHTQETIKPHEQLLWMHDFNYTPMSSAIGVRRNGHELYILDEIILESAVAKQAAIEFVERYKSHGNRDLLLYGDASGQAGEKHSHPSNYNEIENYLREHGWKVTRRVKLSNPAIRDRQNAVRAKICNAAGKISLFVHPTRAAYVHKGLATVQLKKGSTFIEEDSQYQHVTTAIGYGIEYEWPVVLDITEQEKQRVKNATPAASKVFFNKLR